MERDGQGPRVRLAYLIVPAWDAHPHGGLGYTRSQTCKRRVLATMARHFPSRYAPGGMPSERRLEGNSSVEDHVVVQPAK